ncbi:hypothetical protein [Bradyrhizobium guangdongense]|uniref:Uncharacterized protein n=1 Tax=Bradyrhizobium guangdongense TaxID=1325090 RepID=A0A410V3Z7_9BRAD|nr:hypothetical protein [Bradyrhizobium guangdongense]QAU38451.1 hypothetical protein X265_12770 [Bradyrhizobium guangdongense]QOZ59506.1 hypothetical protein XH86_12760 [Bradyrhizobium guangdongense]GGI33696.1 hypothetical protein GCM10010987_75670 [Bradyrhizobium guangdongense]
MTMLAAYTIMTGLVLGLRYRVLVLPPVILVGWLVIAAISSQPWLSALIFAVLLQISYLAGIVLKGSTRASITQLADSIARPGTY